MTKQELISSFDEVRENQTKRSDYYCGITNNLSQRAAWHNAKFIKHIRATNVDMANEIEIILQNAGFYCGSVAGNAHESDSVYVYIYKITPWTRETKDDDMRTKKYNPKDLPVV